MKKEHMLTTRAQDAMHAEFQLLRAYVERAANKGPAIVVVTSAEHGDGKSLMANTLAEYLARSGRKTALLDASREVNPDLRAAKALEGGVRRDEPVAVSLPDMELGLTRETIKEFIASVRSEFDFTIIDTTPLLASERAMVLSELADGILLSVRVGRVPTDNDKMMIRLLEQSQGNVLGVVTTAPAVIDRFAAARAQAEMPLSERLQALEAAKDVTSAPRAGKRRVFATVAMFTILCGIFAGVATYQMGGYHAIASVVPPGPAKAFMHHIVAQLQHAPN
jgi:hypothetical protein